MGNYIRPQPQIDRAEEEVNTRRSKRKHCDEESDDEDDGIEDAMLNTPKKRKLKSTSQYIYETLFVNGENSDVSIEALGKTWHLHKVYLCQSTYFHGMFTGGWRESSEPTISMSISDENIDSEALDIAFGSLYHEDVFIKPSHVIPVLAAATLLGLDGLILQCAAIMKETLSSHTIGIYHSGAHMYGIVDVSKDCVCWLQRHLMCSQNIALLAQINVHLMTELVKSSDLFVVQVEMDIYNMLKKWVFLHEHPHWLGNVKDLLTESEEFFHSQRDTESSVPYLERGCGLKYKTVFQGLRLQHIINDNASIKVIEKDDLIPSAWLLQMYRQQWIQMLAIEQGLDKGPAAEHTVDFLPNSLRVGRVLQKDGEYCWRWTGYNYGLDLLVSFTNRLVLFKRNTHGRSCVGSVSRSLKRTILYRLSVASFSKEGQTKYLKKTESELLELGQDEEIVIMHVDRTAQFPLHISANFLLFKPPRHMPLPTPTDCGDHT